MNRRKHISFYIPVITWLLAFAVDGQESVTSHFFIPSQAVNPSNVTMYSIPGLLLNYRNQWPGNDISFTTYNIGYQHPMKKINSGIGLWLKNDVQGNGIFNQLSFSGTYGYTVKLSNRNRLLFGLQGNVIQYTKNLSGLILEDNSEILSSESGIMLDFDVGSKIIIRDTYFGIYIQHLSPALTLYPSSLNYNPYRRYVAEAGTIIPLKQNGVYQTVMDIRPSIQISQQGGHQYINYGAALRRLNVQLGLWIRQNILFNYDSFIFSLGILQPTYTFVYSYDMRAPWNMHFFGKSGAHEVTFYLQLQYNEKRKRLRTIKCPEI